MQIPKSPRQVVILIAIAVFTLTGFRSNGVPTNDHMIMSVLWFQKAAETRALQYQAFNIARHRLGHELNSHDSSKKPAVIVDIDETVLDNSPYQAESIMENFNYPTGWKEWTQLAQAEAIPGALEFLRYADSSRVEIFYVSNRKIETIASTLENLNTLGFPQADENHLYLRTTDTSKENRRERISQDHEVILLIGDNLNDFSEVFEKQSVAKRFEQVERLHHEFGRRFIVLPNPMYGEWEGAVYDYRWQLQAEKKAEIRKKALEGY